MPGTFIISKGTSGKFRFNLVSTNGQVVATSEAYNSKASAMGGIRAVKSLADAAAVEDQTTKEWSAGAAARKAPAAPKKAAPPATNAGGGACGYFSTVGLFGGPAELRGCGQSIPPGNERSASPSVTLPPGGSATAVTAIDSNGALAQYGPAVLFGGRPPADGNASPPSGPMKVSTKGVTSVTSSASVKNVGAGPFTAGSVRSTCTASKSGVKASTAISKGLVVTATDSDGDPKTTRTVPAQPPVNHTVKGKTATGDSFKVVFNEQAVSRDGRTIVVAAHLYLLGPTAVGDLVIAESYSRV